MRSMIMWTTVNDFLAVYAKRTWSGFVAEHVSRLPERGRVRVTLHCPVTGAVVLLKRFGDKMSIWLTNRGQRFAEANKMFVALHTNDELKVKETKNVLAAAS